MNKIVAVQHKSVPPVLVSISASQKDEFFKSSIKDYNYLRDSNLTLRTDVTGVVMQLYIKFVSEETLGLTGVITGQECPGLSHMMNIKLHNMLMATSKPLKIETPSIYFDK